jgi:hypothetical protein
VLHTTASHNAHAFHTSATFSIFFVELIAASIHSAAVFANHAFICHAKGIKLRASNKSVINVLVPGSNESNFSQIPANVCLISSGIKFAAACISGITDHAAHANGVSIIFQRPHAVLITSLAKLVLPSGQKSISQPVANSHIDAHIHFSHWIVVSLPFTKVSHASSFHVSILVLGIEANGLHGISIF